MIARISGVIRNLAAKIRGRRAQANVAAVIASFESAAQSADTSAHLLLDELAANRQQIFALQSRNNEVFAHVYRARRVASKLREFTS